MAAALINYLCDTLALALPGQSPDPESGSPGEPPEISYLRATLQELWRNTENSDVGGRAYLDGKRVLGAIAAEYCQMF